jgi:hypothetical protein
MTSINKYLVKNKLIIILLLITGSVSAQDLNKKLLLSSSIVFSRDIGSRKALYQQAFFPKFFANMWFNTGAKIGGIYLFNKNLGAGAIYNCNFMQGWNYKQINTYTSSKAIIQLFSPVIYYQAADIISPKITAYVQFGPVLSIINATLKNQVFYIEDNTGHDIIEIKSTNHTGAGFNFSAGAFYPLNETTNFSITVSYSYFTTSSVLYPDTRVNLCSVEAGLIFKVSKDKRYYYK